MSVLRQSAWLVLEDGTAFRARSVGAEGEAFGEVVFNTSMTGYQEVLTDPSYKGQIVCMTYPHIGNYGVNDDDVESRQPWVEAFVMRERSSVASNFRAQMDLSAYLRQHGILAIDQLDTRALTLKLRLEGSMKGGISTRECDPQRLLERVRESPSIVGADYVKDVTCREPYEWPIKTNAECGMRNAEFKFNIVVIDYGVKYNILRQLAGLGCYVNVVPATMPAGEILAMKPDGVVLSNGPADPAAVTYGIETIRALIGQMPMLGICLGHQLLGLAFGGKTYKLKFGHHGGNHPVKDLQTGKVEITTQNHGFAVDLDSIPDQRVELTHVNLNDQAVEGMRHKELPIFSLQYHPEAAPGPHDARHLFQRFLDLLERAHA
ncbi:MAG: glutamine-hydrolyzing carbamoyl-phosphate synthase small subunit [Candidatus Omnitrophica bacterium]|nr:glutamine-hydrolyzing carbamoyl-phosphate synthase small subunit [Candidatus Omnitrophota bacterium]